MNSPSAELAFAERPFWLVIAVCYTSLASGQALLAGLPYPIALCLPLAVFMTLSTGLRLSRPALVLPAALLLGFVPGTIAAQWMPRGVLEASSLLNLLYSLCLFVVVYTYVEFFLAGERGRLERLLRLTLYATIPLCFIEMATYLWVLEIRQFIYQGETMDSFLRDVLTYFAPRPTLLFSEVSNFARAVGLLLGLYAVVAQRPFMVVALSIAFALITRSPMVIYAAPAITLSLLRDRDIILRKTDALRLTVVGTLLVAGVFFVLLSQVARFSDTIGGTDGSYNARVGFPLEYMVEKWGSPLFGDGPTSQERMYPFIRSRQIQTNPNEPDLFPGIAPTFVLLSGLGALGFSIFIAVMYVLLGIPGLVMVAAFLFSNLLASGSNSPTMYVPAAIMLASCGRLLPMVGSAGGSKSAILAREREAN